MKSEKVSLTSNYLIFASRSEGRAYSLNAREVAPASIAEHDFSKDRSPIAIGMKS